MNKYDTLNEKQREACFCTEGPLLLLAGAGSGKTRVLTHRIAYILENNLAKPWEIMAITFTNKASKEMAERVESLLGECSQVFVSTFHSACMRFLRRDIDKLGFSKSFTIYDTTDSKKVIKDIVKNNNLDKQAYKEAAVLSEISKAKNLLMSPDDYYNAYASEHRKRKIAEIYEQYQKELKKNNALDFGDLLYYMVKLFESEPDVLAHYQNKFKYILVDEYQDTNMIQFKIVNMLAKKHKNLCVVGDDDQSIYKFRGADITNILSFEKYYPSARVIKLEQNYRSTKNILDAANAVIKGNTYRKAKRLWTENPVGEKISFYNLPDEKQEARVIVELVGANLQAGYKYKDQSVLYRTNAQSRVIEERLFNQGIPYKILGGTNFYQRKEIKDFIAYLRLINEPKDDVAFDRIINYPKRGIGASTVNQVKDYAIKHEMSLFEVLEMIDEIDEFTDRNKKKLGEFAELIRTFAEEAKGMDSLEDFAADIVDRVGFYDELHKEKDKAEEKIANVRELIGKFKEYDDTAEEISLTGFLEDIALISDVDGYDEDADYVTLMTLHSAKGLEFPLVYMPGMEDGLFPSYMSINEGDEQVEEERRLCYVGITRAQEKLVMLSVKNRFLNGNTSYNPVSRFIEEIPDELLDVKSAKRSAQSYSARQKVKERKPTPYKSYYKAAKKDVKPAKEIDLKVGDFVMHKKYEVGEILEIRPAGADYELSVNFTSVGLKKIMANLSGVKKIDF